MVGRVDGWQKRLVEYLDKARSQEFKPGRHDCALFAAGAVEAVTGKDLASHWRGHYNTLRGGLRVLKREGYSDHIALAASHFRQLPEGVAPSAGDLAVVETEAGPALAVVQGTHIYALGESGLGVLPLDAAATFFEVK